MQWLLQWFDYPADSLLLSGNYSPGLMLLSFAIAVLSSAMAMQVTAQAVSIKRRDYRMLMLTSGSIALGAGVWSMHFIGMLAFTLCTEVSYKPGLTILSMLPSIAASWVALDLISKKRLSVAQLWLGGLLVGAGIGTMHYAGMAAMQMSVTLRYDLPMFLLSILVAVVLAMLALWVRFGLKRLQIHPILLTTIASLVMGSAITGMHYTGMAAARFVPPPGFTPLQQVGETPVELAMAITFTTLLTCALVIAVNLLLKSRDASMRASTNESRLMAMMDTAVDGIVTIDAQGLILSMNKAAEQILGWQQQELLGQNVNILTPDTIRAEHDSYLTRYLNTGDAKIIGVGRDVHAMHKDGHPVPVRLAIGHVQLPGEDLFVAFITDLRARQQMEQALKDNEAKYRSLIGNIPGAAYRCLFNDSWDMLFLSDAIEGISGYPASDFMLPDRKRSWVDVIHPEDTVQLQDPDLFRRGFHVEYRIVHRDGSMRWALEQGEPVYDEQGNILWLDGFIMDITTRKQMETELREARDKAELAAEARAAFLANMSHEIRTPMNAIIGFSDLLLSSALTAEQKKHLSTIHSSAHSLLHLLNDILDSAKLEKGKLELELQDFSLPAVLDSVVSTLWIQARKKQLTLELELAADLGEFYLGAPDRLRQILLNLLGNAIKFTEVGGVWVTVRPLADHEVQFDIRDSGIGIAPERLEQIFEAFTQADSSMSRRFGGTGLGTTISKQLVELMGGRIWVQSEPGVGSTFSFVIPLQTGQTPAQSRFGAQAPLLPPLRILIADDIPQNLELLGLMLSRAGHQVYSATDGMQAVTLAQQQLPELILMDIQMPVLDGLSACRALRHWEQALDRPPIPVIALTASVLDEDKTAAQQAGMQGFASKPVDFPALCYEIARVLHIDIQTPLDELGQTVSSHEQLINVGKALQLWGSFAQYLPALQQFLDKQGQALQQLQLALAQLDFTQIQQVAHAVKGAAGNLALEALAKGCAELEQAARQQQPARTADLLEKILHCWPRITAEYQQLRQQQPAAQASGLAPCSTTELAGLLTALQSALSRHELDEQRLADLEAYHGPLQQQVQHICNLINDFDFSQALQQVHQLLQQLAGGEHL